MRMHSNVFEAFCWTAVLWCYQEKSAIFLLQLLPTSNFYNKLQIIFLN